jgi:hypothetical protein
LATATPTEPISRYFQAIESSYEALIDAVESASSHSGAVWSKLLEDVRAGQKDALGLSEKLLSKPADATTYGALLESSMKTQERVLSFAKVLFDQASTAGAEGKSAIERVASANQAVAEAAMELTKSWNVTDTSFADAWRKSFEAFTSPFTPASR